MQLHSFSIQDQQLTVHLSAGPQLRLLAVLPAPAGEPDTWTIAQIRQSAIEFCLGHLRQACPESELFI
ncbi:hypothetical protein [Alcaligenes sp. SDU_A2]|uniref:hypothetical protein n=1 Tax=Alcaligenes sp. SDU_A2 TaxID=3136634 RepID=UPI00311E4A83